MAGDSTSMDQAVSRAVRANLDSLQRQSEELHQAIADLVAACSSTRPSNALTATLRAQTAAAALSASLEVLARFISLTGQPQRREPSEGESIRVVAIPPPQVYEAPSEPEPPAPSIPVPMSASIDSFEPPITANEMEAAPTSFDSSPQEEIASVSASLEHEDFSSPQPETPVPEAAPSDDGVVFDLNSLSQEQQDMHHRANRVAKVSMQDIQMLKPDQVKLGREHKDLCLRLHEEIGKARKDYERRFGPILGHGVDYFYHWMVEVLAAGDPEALGEYPHSSAALRQ
jgi:hypothetical protein